MLYKICTENKNYDGVVNLVAGKFTGFAIIKADGYWEGGLEHALIIEIVTPDGQGDGATRDKVEHLAYAIKKLNGQQSVLVQYIPETHRFL